MEDGSIVYRCPVKMVTRDTINCLNLSNHCEKFGELPFSGSLAQQPAKVMFVLSFIQRTLNEKHREQMEKIKNGKNTTKH